MPFGRRGQQRYAVIYHACVFVEEEVNLSICALPLLCFLLFCCRCGQVFVLNHCYQIQWTITRGQVFVLNHCYQIQWTMTRGQVFVLNHCYQIQWTITRIKTKQPSTPWLALLFNSHRVFMPHNIYYQGNTTRVIDLQTYSPIDLQTYRPTDLQTYRPTDLQTFRHTDQQTFRPTDL